MHSELTNLLPVERQSLLVREYFYRLGVVIAGLFTVLVCIAGVLLAPSYLYLVDSAHSKEAHLANIKSTLSSVEEKALSTRLASLSSDVAALVDLSKRQTVSTIMRSVLAISRPGITLSGLTYTPISGAKKANTLSLTGVASARDALRNYQLALQSSPFAVSAELPVSAYAKDADIAFTITITLAP